MFFNALIQFINDFLITFGQFFSRLRMHEFFHSSFFFQLAQKFLQSGRFPSDFMRFLLRIQKMSFFLLELIEENCARKPKGLSDFFRGEKIFSINLNERLCFFFPNPKHFFVGSANILLLPRLENSQNDFGGKPSLG